MIYTGLEDIARVVTGNFWENLQGETIISLCVIAILIVLFLIIHFVFKHKDPTKPEKGFALVVVFIVEKLDGMVENLMGKKYEGFAGYVLPLVCYIGLSFIVGLMGFPNPMAFLGNTFAIGLCTFVLLHANAAKANKWAYFHRYIEPLPFLLPINLLSMWAPLLSISLRIFGNALSGYTLMGIIYWALGGLGDKLIALSVKAGDTIGHLGGIIVPPLITWIFHAYFDAFSGMIQTLIFIMLTMIWIGQEDPDPSLA